MTGTFLSRVSHGSLVPFGARREDLGQRMVEVDGEMLMSNSDLFHLEPGFGVWRIEFAVGRFGS